MSGLFRGCSAVITVVAFAATVVLAASQASGTPVTFTKVVDTDTLAPGSLGLYHGFNNGLDVASNGRTVAFRADDQFGSSLGLFV